MIHLGSTPDVLNAK